MILLALALAAPALAAEPATDSGTINIMRPEQPAPAKKKSTKTNKARRGSSNPVYPIPLPRPQAPLPVPHLQTVTPQRAKNAAAALCAADRATAAEPARHRLGR